MSYYNNTAGTVLLIEDSGAGFDFFRRNLPDIQCISAEGNSKITSRLNTLDSQSSTLVFADGAAFGAYIENIITLRELRKNIGLYLPESFEWLILKSGVINSTEISDILEHPEDYIDSSVYFSWERYFTELLEKETADDQLMKYSKSKISDYYISDRILQKILSVMPEKIIKFLT